MNDWKVGIVTCGALHEQIEEYLASLPGSFHIYPIIPACTFSVKIDLIRHYLDRATAENDVTLLAYGVCHPQLLPLLAEYGDRVVRIQGSNCYEMLLGSEKHSEYHRKSYWMLNKPFFTKWKNDLLTGFGAGTSNGRALIGDTFKMLVYLRFEKDELSTDLVEDFARIVGLEYAIQTVDTANLRRLLDDALASAYSTARVDMPKPSMSYPRQPEMQIILESVGEVIYKVDVHTKEFTFVSPQVRRILGYTPAEFLDVMNDYLRTPFYHEDDRQQVVAGRHSFLVKCLNEGVQEPYEAEYRAEHKNGDVLWLRESIYPSYTSEGVIESFIGKIADITEQKRAEEELKSSRDYLKKLTDSMWDAVFSVKMPERVIEWANDSFRLTGYEPEECIGETTQFLYPDERGFFTFGDKLESAIAGGKDVLHTEQLLKRKNGEVFPAEITTTLLKEKGEIVRVTSIVRDVTERKRVEEEELRKFKTVSDRAGYGAAISKPDGTLVYVNEVFAQMHGYTVEELIGEHLSIFHTEEQMKLVERLVNQLLQVHSFVGEEVWHKRKDGTVFPTTMTGTAMIDDKGESLYLSTTAIDITERKRMEEALTESEKRFRGLANFLPLTVFEMDDKGDFTFINRQGFETFGYPIGEITEAPTRLETTFEIFVPEDRDRVRENRQSVLNGDDIGNVGYTAVRRDGSTFPVEVFYAPIIHAGKRTGLRGVLIDITERKRAEEALQESERNFRNSLANSPFGIRVVTADGKLLHANQAILDIYGCSSIEELKAMPTKHRYTPESYVEHQKRKRMRRLGKPVPSTYEIGIVCKDSEVRHLAVFRKEVIWDGKTQFQVLYQDITEQKQAEIALQQSEEFSSSLLTNSPNPVLVINADTSIRYVNPALEKLTGFSSAELIGRKPPYPWWIEETGEESSRKLEKTMRRGARKHEERYRKKNGERFWVEIAFKTVQVDGEFKYHLSNWVDLTERKRLKENMEFYISEITKAQEEERKRIAHEIHDDSIQALVTLALDIDAIAKDKGKLSEDIIQSLGRIRGQTNGILYGLRRFSHELRPGVIDQVGLVPALEILTDELNDEGIGTSLEIMGSERRLKPETELALFRITQEALRNVRKHSGATEATVRLRFIRGKARLTISDNGKGFEVPEILGDLAAESKLGFIGMQERARLLDGRFLVKSHVGKGATIMLEVEV